MLLGSVWVNNMKLCWNNIENIILTKNGNFRDIIKKRTYRLKICKQCKEEFLGLNITNKFCSSGCIRKGKKHTEETKKKISKIHKNKILTEEQKRKIGKALEGKNSPNWTGGYRQKNIASYNVYAPQLEWCEEVRRNKKDLNVLEVRCIKCGKWYIPSFNNITNRIQCINGNKNYSGENRLYCSDECKHSCSIYHKTPETLMKEDAVRAGRLSWLELSREVQPELRKLVLERDGYKCVKCGSDGPLHCHHIYPVSTNPLESADVDNCIILCYNCHKLVHQKDGCRLGQLRMEEC